MKHQHTTVSEKTVRMRLANEADPTQADSWFEFEVPLELLAHPNGRQPLGDPELQFHSEIRLAALRFVRDVIGEETRRLSELAGRMR